MQNQLDAKELYSLVAGSVRGGAPIPAGVFGPYGMERGIREELLKKAGIVSGKIAGSTLLESDVDVFFGVCQVAQASGVLSESDIEKISTILERNL